MFNAGVLMRKTGYKIRIEQGIGHIVEHGGLPTTYQNVLKADFIGVDYD